MIELSIPAPKDGVSRAKSDEPKYANSKGMQSRAHKLYCKGLGILERAAQHLREHRQVHEVSPGEA
jgi:hypothetical protein